MSFFYALRFDITATCVSPLRVMGNFSDDDSILRDKEGRAFIQANSIAGAMRSWFENNQLSDEAKRLFGESLREGELTFSDGIFSDDSVEAQRSRLKVNRFNKILLTSFDVSAMTRGSVFEFTVLWRGMNKEDASFAQALLQRAFCAMNSGEIMIGSQKLNGYGRVELSIKKRSFDLRNPDDQTAWLEQREAEEKFPLEKVSGSSYVIFSVSGEASPVFSKSLSKTYIHKNMVETNIKENNDFLLQASSVKGAVRTRAEDIAKNMFGFSQEDIDLIFGNIYPEKAFAGKVIFSDVVLNPVSESHIASRLQIDRFTSGAMTGRITSSIPLCSKINFEICVPEEDSAACGLILFALRDLGLGIYSLGGLAAVGYGFLQAEKIHASVPNSEDVVMTFKDGAKIVSGKATADNWFLSVDRRCQA